MKRGFSRSAFNRTKRYVGVLMQQGSVILESDWNEETEANLGVMLLEMWANLANLLSYYQDLVASEAFISTASARLRVRKSVLHNVLHTARAVNAITSRIATRQLKAPKQALR